MLLNLAVLFGSDLRFFIFREWNLLKKKKSIFFLILGTGAVRLKDELRVTFTACTDDTRDGLRELPAALLTKKEMKSNSDCRF